MKHCKYNLKLKIHEAEKRARAKIELHRSFLSLLIQKQQTGTSFFKTSNQNSWLLLFQNIPVNISKTGLNTQVGWAIMKH